MRELPRPDPARPRLGGHPPRHSRGGQDLVGQAVGGLEVGGVGQAVGGLEVGGVGLAVGGLEAGGVVL